MHTINPIIKIIIRENSTNYTRVDDQLNNRYGNEI